MSQVTITKTVQQVVVTAPGPQGPAGGGGGGGGTVTSVALTMPAIFTVSGSPVTTTGTLTGTLATQAANQVWCGPTSGGAAAPTFRALVASDIPALPISSVTGLQTALDGKSAVGHTHNMGDITGLSGTLASLQNDIDGKAAISHTHIISNVTGLQAALDAKAALVHTHVIADTTGLQAALDAKAALSHVHSAADITSGTLAVARGGTGQVTIQLAMNAMGAASGANSKGDLLVFNGTNFVRLAKGTDSGALVADSSTATGLRWETPSAEIPTFDAWAETPSGTVNGVNDVFTLTGGRVLTSETLRVFKNGLRQKPTTDYTFVGTDPITITFAAGNIPQTGDTILCDYNWTAGA